MFEYIFNYPHEVFYKILEHIQLTLLAVLLAVAVGIPLGIFCASNERFNKKIMGTINIIQTIPSLALFGFLIPLPFIGGIGAKPAITVLFLYALLPIVKNTYVALFNVDKSVVEAAKGIGMTSAQRLWIVKFPIAFPVIMGGIRMSTVLTIGTVTIAAIIGAGGLGDFIYRGTSTLDYGLIFAGTFPAIVLAIMTDRGLENIETKINIGKFMRKLTLEASRKAIIITLVILSSIMGSFGYFSYKIATQNHKNVIRLGVKNITENRLIGEMIKQELEKSLKKPVVISQLGSTPLLFQAIQHGDIDICTEYTGTAYSAILKQQDVISAEKTLALVQQEYNRQFDIHVFNPIGFDNNFAFALRKEDAQRLRIKNLSELSRYAPTLIIGTTSECHDRYDGLKGLKQIYGLQFKDEKIVELGIRYKAIANHDVDVIDAFTTDGFLVSQDLVALEDDKHFFPPYYAVICARNDFIQKYPQAESILAQFSGLIDNKTIQKMNYQIDVEKKPVLQIASDFVQNGLLQQQNKKAQIASFDYTPLP